MGVALCSFRVDTRRWEIIFPILIIFQDAGRYLVTVHLKEIIHCFDQRRKERLLLCRNNNNFFFLLDKVCKLQSGMTVVGMSFEPTSVGHICLWCCLLEHEKRSKAVGWDLPSDREGRERGLAGCILGAVHKNWSTAQFPKWNLKLVLVQKLTRWFPSPT
jgi:hypothetical protein